MVIIIKSPNAVLQTLPSSKPVKTTELRFDKDVEVECFIERADAEPHTIESKAKDLAFNVRRHADEPMNSWSHWNW